MKVAVGDVQQYREDVALEMHMQKLRLPELDGLRGIACLMVMLDHVIVSSLPQDLMPGLYRLSTWLIGGVDLFFVLSGFLIGGILLDHKDSSNYFQVFWTRRIGRIFPVYYLLMLTFFCMIGIKTRLDAPWLDVFLFNNIMPLWTYLLFVQNFAQSLDGGDGGARWVASTWSLAIEEQFYLLLPPLIYVMRRRSVVALAAMCVIIALLVRAHLWQATGSWFTGYFLLPGRMDSLAFGLLGALAIRNAAAFAWLQRSRRILDLLALIVMAFLSTNALVAIGERTPEAISFLVRSSDFTLRAALFSYALLRIFLVSERSWYRRSLSFPTLIFIGTISYALYMYHQVVNGLLHGVFFADIPRITDFSHLLVALVVIVLSVILAWLSTNYYEHPFRRWSQRVVYRPAPSEARQIGALK